MSMNVFLMILSSKDGAMETRDGQNQIFLILLSSEETGIALYVNQHFQLNLLAHYIPSINLVHG